MIKQITNNMNISIGDMITTKMGGPFRVISVKDNLVTFEMKNGVGQTITQHITEIVTAERKIIQMRTDEGIMNNEMRKFENNDLNIGLNCEYSGLPSVKSYK
jgi:hypothetical protein